LWRRVDRVGIGDEARRNRRKADGFYQLNDRRGRAVTESEPRAEALTVFVEIPTGSRNKYEFDSELGGIVLDRRLFTSMSYPTDYGFVEGTRARDGDPLDALVLTAEPPGCRIRARTTGVFHMEDEHGDDDKLICVPVPVADTVYGRLREADEISAELRNEIEHFFQVYKTLEGKPTRTFGFSPRSRADVLLEQSIGLLLQTGEGRAS
jgi:inorganic pyrophosphatase